MELQLYSRDGASRWDKILHCRNWCVNLCQPPWEPTQHIFHFLRFRKELHLGRKSWVVAQEFIIQCELRHQQGTLHRPYGHWSGPSWRGGPSRPPNLNSLCSCHQEPLANLQPLLPILEPRPLLRWGFPRIQRPKFHCKCLRLNWVTNVPWYSWY